MGYSTFGGRWQLLGLPENPVLRSSTIHSVAGHYDYVVSHVILKWAIMQNVTVIPRSGNPTRIAENYRARETDMLKGDIEAITSLGTYMEELMNGESEAEENNESTVDKSTKTGETEENETIQPDTKEL